MIWITRTCIFKWSPRSRRRPRFVSSLFKRRRRQRERHLKKNSRYCYHLEMDQSERYTYKACKAIVFAHLVCKFVTFSLPLPLLFRWVLATTTTATATTTSQSNNIIGSGRKNNRAACAARISVHFFVEVHKTTTWNHPKKKNKNKNKKNKKERNFI